MTSVSGDVTTYLDAMGKPLADPAAERAMRLIGDSPDVEVEILDGLISKITFAGPRIDGVVDGVTTASSREDVRTLLGEPLRSWYAYDEYAVGERVLDFTWWGDDFRGIAVLAEDRIALNHGIPWAPLGIRHGGRLYLETPISLGVADTTFRVQVTAAHLEVLREDLGKYHRVHEALEKCFHAHPTFEEREAAGARVVDEICFGAG